MQTASASKIFAQRGSLSYVSKRMSWTAYFMHLSEDCKKFTTRRLDPLVAAITDLEVKGSEPWQFTGYYSGHFYGSHTDAVSRALDGTNGKADSTRIATVLIYLNEVELGGATAYSNSDAFARPELGSVAVARNHEPDGNVSAAMRHGGCPVLLGEKIVAVKWIDGPSQFLKLPCTLDDKEPDFSTSKRTAGT